MRSSSRPWVRNNIRTRPRCFLSANKFSKCVLFIPELPEDVIKMAKDIKPITEIKQNGNDFVVTSKTPGKTVTNSFTIGKEADITTMDGKKLKVCWPFWCEPALVTF